MYARNWEDYFGDETQVAPTITSLPMGEISATPTPVPGSPHSLSGTEAYDDIAVDLVGGQTYTFDYRGVPGGVVDPYLGLYGVDGTTLITEDDDGGAGRGAMITFTPTVSGTYHLHATSFYTVDTGDPSIDTGGYTINMWSPEADVPGSTSVAASLPGAVAITVGTTFGNIDAAGDNDYFKINVTAGHVYSFNYSGGVSGSGDFNGEPGENIATVRLYNAAGTLLASNTNFESGVGYFAQADATIYVRLTGYQTTTGGYTLDVGEVDPADRDPLDSIRWFSADNIHPTVTPDGQQIAYVYFAAASEGGFGETESLDDYPPGTPITTYGWEQYQIDGVMSALQEYTPITGIQYVQTTDLSQATFRLVTTKNDDYGARFYPQDPASGSKQGLGIFNLLSGGFGTDPGSLQPGGFAYGVVLHEFGHAHGLAHPHDNGGGSEVMLGVSASTGSYGIYNLNQGVYTVMSYNDGWPLDPDGQRTYSAATRGSGWSETLGAFDIAALQDRYGEHASHTGNDVYAIADVQADSQYRTIWDTGGDDTISYTGARNAQIDLLAATLDYSPTGGGVVSFAHGVFGGFTIANGVVIENATGGSGDDVLLGNSSNNVLTGNSGNDSLVGRDGDDTLDGGAGNDSLTGGNGIDTATYAAAGAGVVVSLAAGTATGGAGSDTIATVENVVGSGFDDTITGEAGANVLNGGGGNDSLDGGDGNDTLDGGADNDALVGGNGTDLANYAAAGAAVVVNLTAGTATGGAGSDTLATIEDVTGSAFNDTLTGDLGVNTLNGGAGNDTLDGAAGNDSLNGGDGTDTATYAGAGAAVTVNLNAGTATGGAGSDSLSSIENAIGSAYGDSLTGGGGANRLDGGAGADRIIGGGGQDVVLGGDGLDVVTLGADNDVYRGNFGSTKVALKTGTMSVDIITDFDASGDDLIDLSGLGLTFHGTDANKNAGDLTYKTYASINGAENALGFEIDGQPGAGGVPGPVTVVYGNSDGGKPDFAIILLNTSSVDASDFNLGASGASLVSGSLPHGDYLFA